MKKNVKQTIFVIAFIVVILGLIAGAIVFTYNFKKDKELLAERLVVIKEEYQVFDTNINAFKEKRKDYYDLSTDYLYLEDFGDKKTEIVTLVDEYNDLINNFYEDSTSLAEYCEITYVDPTAKNRCELFQQGYESITNYFITDMNAYNIFINQYNAYIIDEELNIESVSTIELTHYTEFIDYDNDGEYLGGTDED